MNQVSIRQFLLPNLERLSLHLTDEQLNRLDLLVAAMLADPLYKSVSKIFEPEEIALKHIFDSLIPLCFNLPLWKSAKIVDLGTGGGFPALPLAVLLPQSCITAVDSRKKSVEFVARMAEAVGLKNIVTCHSRIEELGRVPAFREKADLVVCRALSAVRTLVEYTLPLTRTGGYSFYYKGPKLDEELAEAGGAFAVFAVAPEDIEILRLQPPELPFERNFLIISKKRAVPEKFPRKSGLAVEKPL